MYFFGELPPNENDSNKTARKKGILKELFTKRNTPEVAGALGFLGFFMIQADVVLEYSGVSIPNTLENALVYTTGALFVASVGGVAIRTHHDRLLQKQQFDFQQLPTSETE